MSTKATVLASALLAVAACSTNPKPGDTEGPKLVLSSVKDSVNIAASVDGVIVDPTPCPKGTQVKENLPGTSLKISTFDAYHIVDNYPVELNIFVADASGIKHISMHAVGAVISSPQSEFLEIQGVNHFFWQYPALQTARNTGFEFSSSDEVFGGEDNAFVFKHQSIFVISMDAQNNHGHLRIITGLAADLCE